MTCPRAGKLFGGCKFSPRYDRYDPQDIIQWMMSDTRGVRQVQPARTIYICDVCERCGKTLVRRKANSQAAEGTAGKAMGHNPAVGAA